MNRNNPKFEDSYSRLLIHIISLLAIYFLFPSSIVIGKELGTLRNFKHGEQLPPINLPQIDNSRSQIFTPGDGKPTIIMFFSIKPDFRKTRALAMLSSLADLSENYKGKIEVVCIYSDETDAAVVQAYIKSSSINMKVLNDTFKDTYNQYGVFMMPLVIMTDSSGKLHEVIPYTFNVREIIDGNIKMLLGEWNKDQLNLSLQPKQKILKTEEEKEYIRRINYGKIMLSKKMNAQAIREFSTATKLMPDMIDAYLELGFSFIAAELFSEAQEPFKKALQIDAESDDAIAGIGLSFYGLGLNDKALPELENAFISADPRLEVIIALANIYEKIGDNTKANRLNKLAVTKLMVLYQQRWK